MEMEDEPDPDMESMRARLEQLVADNTEKDIARRQAEQRADDLSAAQTQAEAERDAARADHTHTLELLAGAETALAAEQAEHAIARDKAASDSAAATARYGDLESRYTATLDDYAGEVHRADNLLRKLNAANEELERERAEHADTRANYIKDIEAAAAKTADVDRQRDAEVALRVEAKNTQRQAEAAREAAIQRAEAAERDKGIAEQAQQAANQLIEERRQVERARMVGVIAAHRALIADVMSRMVQRETEKARRNQATPEKLRKWAESFYSLHEQTCVEALIPAVRAHLAWLQRFDDSEAVARTLVRAHIRESVTQLRAVADADPDEYHGLLERTLTRWETERPHALADAVQKEAISYVAGD